LIDGLRSFASEVSDAKLALRPVGDVRVQQAIQQQGGAEQSEEDIMEVRLRDEQAERKELEAQRKALAETTRSLRVRRWLWQSCLTWL
jgi:hypothetical protein